LGLTHGQAVVLIVAGGILFGLVAPLAGWLGDRWSATGMMGVFFVGTGGSMIMIGTADSPFMIGFWLAVTGTFAAIYHPVGISWLVRIAKRTGVALGINGVFGGLGPAAATLSAGALIDFYGWRAAFFVPGCVVAATAVLFYVASWKGLLLDSKTDMRPMRSVSSQDRTRVFAILAFTLICTGLIFQATQPAVPKVFAERLTEFAADGVFGISVLVAVVYAVAGFVQIIGGHMVDRFPMRAVYLTGFILQIPLLILAGMLSGTELIVISVIMVSVSIGSLPVENVLIAAYTPIHMRGLVFGCKFILALGIGSLGVWLEGALFDFTGDFLCLFVILATLAGLAGCASLLLPAEGRQSAPAPAE
jgi:FSR family fosmidomycin resistance protein-like MFS transporter